MRAWMASMSWATAAEQVRLLGVADQVLVEDELVAVGHQQVRRRRLDAQPDHVAIVLPQLGYQRREVGIARDQREGVDVGLAVGEVERVHDHPDVGRVLAAVAALRHVDQLDGPLVERPLVFGEAIPVGVGAADDDLALLEQALQDQLDLELLVLRFFHTAGDVLEVDEQRQLTFPVHALSS
jgi:hypothetical protein